MRRWIKPMRRSRRRRQARSFGATRCAFARRSSRRRKCATASVSNCTYNRPSRPHANSQRSAATRSGKDARGTGAERSCRGAGDLLQAADLLQSQSLRRYRHGRRRGMAGLFRVSRFRTRVRHLTSRRKPRMCPKEGARHIFGYTIFNDMSARDAQASKWKAGSAPARARISTPAIPWAPVSSPRTS